MVTCGYTEVGASVFEPLWTGLWAWSGAVLSHRDRGRVVVVDAPVGAAAVEALRGAGWAGAAVHERRPRR